MLVSFDIKFVRRDQKEHRHGEACRISPTCFWSSLIDMVSEDTYVVLIYHALYADCMAKRYWNKRKAHSVLFELAYVANAL